MGWTNAELIQHLQKLPQDLPAMLFHGEVADCFSIGSVVVCRVAPFREDYCPFGFDMVTTGGKEVIIIGFGKPDPDVENALDREAEDSHWEEDHLGTSH